MRQASRKIVLFGMCLDLAVCGISLLVATSMLHRFPWDADTLVIRHPLRQLISIVSLSLIWQLSMVATGAYQSYRLSSWTQQVVALAAGTGFAAFWAAIWLSVGQWTGLISLQRILSAALTFWAISFLCLLATRFLARLFTHVALRDGRSARNVLIVGSNRRATALADGLIADGDSGYKLLGFIDSIWHFDGAPEHYKQMLLGGSGDILGLIRTLPLDEVIIALPIASSYQFTQQIMDWCSQQGILVRCDGSLFDYKSDGRQRAGSSQRLITLHDTERNGILVLVKRFFDVVVSTLALVALSPVILGIALAIRISSPGPVLFLQERLGIAKRRFKICKFRTMVVDAEAQMAKVEHLNQSAGPTFKLKHDPRITRIGVFLRKTSLDELPQLFNVWLGDMSLVGPRPLPLRDYKGFSEDWHRRRFSVKPGITCLWQVSGRSSIGFDEWMQLDMDYIDRWSFWLDLKILAQTIPAVVKGSGAM
jgi:exopolysaccharide biosynthesis polyprenyl glycosylphosphotransferase